MKERNKPQVKVGKVVRVSGRTARVVVSQTIEHKLYRKIMKQQTSYLVDVNEVIPKLDQLVIIMKCRPVSKRKHWRVTEIVDTKTAEKEKSNL